MYPRGGWTIWSRPWGVRVSRARCRACFDVVVLLGPTARRAIPYLWLDFREAGRIVWWSTAVNGEGKREIIGRGYQ